MMERNELADDVIDTAIALIVDTGLTQIEIGAKNDSINIKVNIEAGYNKERESDEL